MLVRLGSRRGRAAADRGRANTSDSGSTSSMSAARDEERGLPMKASIKARASGERRGDCPNEPAAVPAPRGKRAPVLRHELAERGDHDGETSSRRGRGERSARRRRDAAWRARRIGREREAERVEDGPRAKHAHSAIAIGDPAGERLQAPQSRFWIAIANENTSRPQPWVTDSGVRNWPSAERGPKASIAITQPQTIRTAGVRQARPGAVVETVDIRGGPGSERSRRPLGRGEDRARGIAPNEYW